MTIRFAILTAALVALVPIAQSASAHDKPRLPHNTLYQEECGTCHVAYPPGLLPPRSWAAIMAGLDRHFGSDASLDAANAQAIAGFLAANAGRSGKFDAPGTQGGPNLKITETPWFKRKHREGHHGITAAVWQSAAVKTPANCGACHPQAAAGNYEEDDIRLPRAK